MLIALDTETHKVEPGLLAPKLVCTTWSDGSRKGLLNRIDGLAFARKALSDHTVSIVGHRISYDLAVFAAEDPSLLPLIFDAFEVGRIFSTDVRQKLIDIAQGQYKYYEQDGKKVKNKFSLAQLSERYLGKTMLKGKNSWQLRFDELDDLPVSEYPEEAAKYALGDAVDTLLIKQAQDKYCEYEEIPTESLQTKAAWALHLMSVWGIRTDPEATAIARDKLVKERAELHAKLVDIGIVRKDGTKNQGLIKEKVVAAYAKLGTMPPLTEAGNICIDRDSLAESEDPELTMVSEFVHTDKLLGTYIPLLLSGNKIPFNAAWNVLVSSGRTSCGGGEDETTGNLQNLPRKGDIRGCFVPREGTYYCASDYSTAELRSWSQILLDLVGRSTMAEEFKRGLDPHLAFAAELLHTSYENAFSNRRDEDVKNSRQFSKIANFGFPGGLQPPGLIDYAKGYGIIIDLAFSRQLYGNWLSHYSEAKEYFGVIKAMSGGYGLGSTVKHHRTGFVRGDLSFTELANHEFQHLTATGFKAALWDVTKECYVARKSPLFGSRPVLAVHDEIISEVPTNCAHEAAQRQSELMVKAMQPWTPDIPVIAEPALMRRWIKGAESVYEEGRLVPYGS